jgi:hypothetical protein
MAFAAHVHQVEFIDKAMSLEERKSAIDRDAVDAAIEVLGLAQDL